MYFSIKFLLCSGSLTFMVTVWFSVQGKRVAGDDGSEGYSDMFQENAMLQRENDTMRLRVKAMQETIDHLNTRVTHLVANQVSSLLTKSST